MQPALSQDIESEVQSVPEFLQDLQEATDQANRLVDPITSALTADDQRLSMQTLRSRLLQIEQDSILECTVTVMLQKVVLIDPELWNSFVETVIQCRIENVLSAAVAILKNMPDLKKVCLRTTIKTLKHVLLHTCCWEGFIARSADDDQSAEAWVSVILFVPQLVAIACRALKHSLPSWSTPSRYLTHLIRFAASKWHAGEKDARLGLYLRGLVQRLLRRSQGEYVARGLWEGCQQSHPSINNESLFTYLSKHLTAKELGSLCYAMLRFQALTLCHESDDSTIELGEQWIQACCPILLASRLVQDALVRSAILQEKAVLPNLRADEHLVELVVQLLVQVAASESPDYDTDDSSAEADETTAFGRFCLTHMDTVATVWSQASFVRQVDESMQQHVSHFLVYGLSMEPDVSIDPGNDLLMKLLSGVSHRLSSSIPGIRKSGMRIGEAVAKRLGQELQFDELRDSENHPNGTTAIEIDNTLKRASDASSGRTKDSAYDRSVTYEPMDDDSDWGSDNDLLPYELNDDEEDLRETPRPLYLNECLDLLRAPETDENAASKIITVLRELPALVRSRPADLGDVGHHLALQLVNSENRFNWKDFEEYTLESLAALTVLEPISVGIPLIDAMFEDLSLRCRIDILNTLNRSAFELSGAKEIQAAKHLRIQFSRSQQGSSRVSGKSHLLADSSMSSLDAQNRTRRWGRGKGRPEPALIFNHFGSVAASWFYATVGLFMKRKDDRTLWAGDTGSKFLSHLLVSMAVIVESSGNTPGTSVIAGDLFQLVWSFRDADASEVRAAVLCGVATSLACLDQESILSLLASGSAEGLPHYLVETYRSDPDKGCRELAHQVSETVTHALRSITM